MGQKRKINGKLIKVPVYIDAYYEKIRTLSGGKDGKQRRHYELSYRRAKENYDSYWDSERHTKGDEDLRISLYLDNAKYGNLHIFVLDFDDYDEESHFFSDAKQLADKVTRSQGGGYHMFYEVDKEVATPLFDSINLLASENSASFVCKTGAVTLDGTNKVDLFCDTRRLMYEWEPWDNTVGLTDKTQELYELIKANFELKRPMSGGKGKQTSGKGGKSYAMLEERPEEELLRQMSAEQREVFADLETKSSDCSSSQWFSIGIDIYHVFGAELGGKVFFLWSKPRHNSVEHPTKAYSGKQAMLNEYLDDPEHYRKFVNVIPDLFDLYDAIETEFAVAYNENGRMYGRKSYSGYKEGSPVGKSKFCMSDIYYKIPDGLLYPILAAFRVLLEYDITSGKYKWMDGKDPIAVWNKHKVGLTRSVMDLAGSLGDKPTVFGKDPSLWNYAYMVLSSIPCMPTLPFRYCLWPPSGCFWL